MVDLRTPQTDNPLREYLLYAVFNVVAIALQLGCLGFSRYVLDLSSPLSDNISGTLIGQIVAVVFRYWAYDKFVFRVGQAAATEDSKVWHARRRAVDILAARRSQPT